MREIKFRFWVVKASKMSDWETAKKECDRLSLLSVDGFIPMQYTGLKDKNGVEIYEGDIVDNDTGNYMGVITFDNACFLHRGSPLGYFVEDGVVEDNRYDPEDTITLQEGNVGKWAIVIGNMYENPELLNK